MSAEQQAGTVHLRRTGDRDDHDQRWWPQGVSWSTDVVGPEDITYWPGRDELWSLTEYPGRRYVFAMDRRQLA